MTMVHEEDVINGAQYQGSPMTPRATLYAQLAHDIIARGVNGEALSEFLPPALRVLCLPRQKRIVTE